MFLVFDPETLKPTGVSHAMPEHSNFVPISPNTAKQFVHNPAEMVNWQVVRSLSKGYYLAPITQVNPIDEINKLREIQQINDIYDPENVCDVALYLHKDVAELKVFDGSKDDYVFYITKTENPHTLEETLNFHSDDTYLETDVMQRVIRDRFCVWYAKPLSRKIVAIYTGMYY